MRLLLTVTDGPHLGKTFTFDRHAVFFVGRAPQVQFRLSEEDPYFSRIHFMVEVNPPLCRLVDLGSTNKTYVNGRQVTTADLGHGDQIRAGHTTMTVAIEDTAGTVPPHTPPAASPDPAPTLRQDQGSDGAAGPPPAIPGYTIVRELGSGAMGVVYLARREADGAEVAVKTILPAVTPTPPLVGRFLREAEVLRRLRHRHIVSFHDMGEADGLLYFTMDYVPGPSAAAILHGHGGPLPVGRAVRWLVQVLEALGYAHAAGYVHRDVKPGNFLVVTTADGEEVRLADFGLARAYEESHLSGLTRTGAAGGTPAYMPPEQVLDFRNARPAADQYAAAATLYHLLTDRLLYDGVRHPLDFFPRILTEDPVPVRARRPDLPEGLAAAVHRALRRDPDARFPDVGRFRAALLEYAAG